MASMGDAQRVGQGGLTKLTDGPRTTSDLGKVGGALTRGPNQGKKLNAAAWSETWPAPGSTLDLDFANDRGWVRGVGQGGVMDAITFTRASNGNYVKPDGTLSSHANQGALGNNLLTFPQDFDNAAWIKSSLTIAVNAEIAPDGTNSAELVYPSSTGNRRSTTQTVSFAGSTIYTMSVYVKYAGIQWVFLGLGGRIFSSSTGAYFDLVNATVGSVATGYSNAAIALENNGYYRLSVSVDTSLVTPTSFTIGLVNANGGISVTANDQDGIFIWGAQLEVGSTATEYFPTNISEPRFDWASTEQLPQNLLRYTEEFDNAVWTKTNTTVTANATTAPDGTTTADKLITTATTTTANYLSYSLVSADRLASTFSIYAKAEEVYEFGLFFTVHNTNANFNLVDETATISGASGVSASITSVGDGWFRCSVATSANTHNSVRIYATKYGVSYTGDGTSGIYIWGAQLEKGDTATDYQAVGSAVPSTTPLAANPTSNGILIEEARTNRLLWNRDATQTEWVKTDITAAKDQTGVDGVANAASSLTATADNGTCIQTITLASGSRTGSVYLKRITGTGTVQVTLDGSTYSTVELSTSEWRRIVLSGTVTNPTVGIKLAVSGDAVAMDYGQVEDGAWETSPILTTTASVTRAIDAASMTGQSFISWYNQNGGTFVVDSWTKYPANATNSPMIQVNNGTSSYRIDFNQSGSGDAGPRISGTVRIGADNEVLFSLQTSWVPRGAYEKVVLTYNPSGGVLTSTSNLARQEFSSRRLPYVIQALFQHNGYYKSIRFAPNKVSVAGTQNLVKR